VSSESSRKFAGACFSENCPEVELTPTGVRIGEEGNLATLTHKEWSLLVDLIRSGQLKKVRV
jgi:hypothetical protein